MKKTNHILTLILILIAINCEYNPLEIPKENESVAIGVNSDEIKYLKLNPSWTMAHGLNFDKLSDIYISLDDYIYIADKGNSRVVVFNKSGNPLYSDGFGNDFSVLEYIPQYGSSGGIISPRSIAVDSKLNVFIIDSSNVIYRWNQYLNNIRNLNNNQNDSIAVSIIYHNIDTEDEVEITDFRESYYYESNGYNIISVNYIYNPAYIDSVLAPHPFYIDVSGEKKTVFRSVAAAPAEENSIYLTDESNQRIIDIKLERSGYIKFSNGVTLWLHKGVFDRVVATSGTGAGTVNFPSGMFCDDGNNIYYTQTGPEFGFHKIKYIPGDYDGWNSAFTLNAHEILDLGRFENPMDVTVSETGNIFVLNTDINEVQEFDFSGEFVRKAGLREVKVDTTVIDTIITPIDTNYVDIDTIITPIDTNYVDRDTIMTSYYHDILDKPGGIAVDDGIIYILNSGKDEILRFQLSDEIDINPDDLQ